MDYYTFFPDIAETLVFLKPPPVRGSSQGHGEGTFDYCESNYTPLDVFMLNDLRKIKEKSYNTLSSTSLVLKKTVERNISNLANIKPSGDTLPDSVTDSGRPTIKVTVIPNRAKPCNKKIKKKHTTKKIHSVASNLENSINASNVIFVVAGKNKEKIYKVKTVGSAHAATKTRKKNDRQTDEVIYFEEFVNPSEMDWKKKKGKKKVDKSNPRLKDSTTEVTKSPSSKGPSSKSPSSKSPSLKSPCSKSPNSSVEYPEDSRGAVTGIGSCLKICSRIGLTKDNEYYINTTLASKHQKQPAAPKLSKKESFVSTSVSNNQSFDSTAVNYYSQNYNMRDSYAQTPYEHEITYIQPTNTVKVTLRRNQVTQTKSMGVTAGETIKIYSHNENVQYLRNEAHDAHLPDDENKTKGSSSPIVVISVFQKKDSPDTFKRGISVDQGKVEHKKANKGKANKQMSPSRSPKSKPSSASGSSRTQSPARSPRAQSPARSDTDNAEPKNRKNKVKPSKNLNKPSSGSVSPRTPSPSPSKSPPKTKKKNNSPKGKPSEKEPNKFPKKTRDKNVSTSTVKSGSSKDSNKSNTKEKRQPAHKGNKRKSSTLSTPSRGTNTDQQLAKKAIVDSYTKSLGNQMNKKHHKDPKSPKNMKSNIAINIDSEKEYYDVVFQNDQLITDLRFRKTVKDQGSQDTHSLENFFFQDDAPRKSFSQAYIASSDKTKDGRLRSLSSIFHVRDSIEISHRREEKEGSEKTSLNPSIDRTKILINSLSDIAPVKHYPGDDCGIVDPVQRDKEIRELLGLKSTRDANLNLDADQMPPLSRGDSSSLRCHYHLNKKRYQLQREDDYTDENHVHEQKLCDHNMKLLLDSISKKPSFESSHNLLWKDNTTSESSFEMQSSLVNKIHKSAFHQYYHERRTQCSPQLSTTYQVILNRRFCLQIEQLAKQKPIVLTRKQYSKIKRQIATAALKKSKVCVSKKYSLLSVGQVKRNYLLTSKNSNVSNQEKNKLEAITEAGNAKVLSNAISFNNVKNLKLVDKQSKSTSTDTRQGKNGEKGNGDQENCVFQNEILGSLRGNNKNFETLIPCSPENTHKKEHVGNNFRDGYIRCQGCDTLQNTKHNFCNWCGMQQLSRRNVHSKYFHTNERSRSSNTPRTNCNKERSYAESSVEIRYTNLAYKKHVTFSSTRVEEFNHATTGSQQQTDHVKRIDSIITIFKGHRKSPTPNLGTSAYSLNSDGSVDVVKHETETSDPKPRKPFLKRLMSCLVMRSTGGSEIKLRRPDPKPDPTDSSFDSYHISTCDAIELSSSMYDTSDSFYSSHTIHPIHGKLKRGLLYSMRGLLTNKKC